MSRKKNIDSYPEENLYLDADSYPEEEFYSEAEFYPEADPLRSGETAMEIDEAQRVRREKRDVSSSARMIKRKAAQEKEAEENSRKAFVTGRRLGVFVVVVVIVALIGVSGKSIMTLNETAVAAEKAYVEKEEEKARLDAEYSMINDPEYIESQARERLKMIKPGEKMYIFEEKYQEAKEDK